MTYRILVADGETSRSARVVELLRRDGYSVEAVRRLEAGPEDPLPDLLVLDAGFLDPATRQRLTLLRERAPELPLILLKGTGSPDPAPVEGVSEILSSPPDPEFLSRTVRRLSDAAGLRAQTRRQYGLAGLIGTSRPMQSILEDARQMARSQAGAILIRGESGTGKDLLARAIHYESARADRPFVTVMCTALQDTLLENDLFGHEKGAFTDAKGQKRGIFETADGGTIFLNEIGDMSPNLQAKLLQVLDEQTFRRVGGSDDIRVDVRVIAATNCDLEKAIQEGRFRLDLFYRLNIFPLMLPPLRDRRDDIPLFVEHFLQRNARKYRRRYTGLLPGAMAKLQAYRWPGNVRELRNVLERASALCAGTEIREEDLRFWEMGGSPVRRHTVELPPEGVLLEDVEKELVTQALDRTSGNQTQAAALLGISRFRLRCRMKRHGLSARAPRPAPRP
ncbi:MAG TPA: sigma-54 dependent transcriptional regulator [Planctomycetota bacterium]|nr:sigma-54 dependent transcriptional regulator [Planctomycetota bacterium]